MICYNSECSFLLGVKIKFITTPSIKFWAASDCALKFLSRYDLSTFEHHSDLGLCQTFFQTEQEELDFYQTRPADIFPEQQHPTEKVVILLWINQQSPLHRDHAEH